MICSAIRAHALRGPSKLLINNSPTHAPREEMPLRDGALHRRGAQINADAAPAAAPRHLAPTFAGKIKAPRSAPGRFLSAERIQLLLLLLLHQDHHLST